MSTPPPLRRPVTSYRLQLGPSCTFGDAARLVPYLQQLGVTELYCSPILAARPGSSHGYDVCDHSRFNPELGGEAGFAELAQALKAADMGLLVDFVPNHMSTHPAANGWWRSVLENGPSSPVASHFDIDWDPVKPELKGRLLLPILGDQYGVALEAGQLQVVLEHGTLDLRYFEHDLPLNPRQLRMVLAHGLDALRAGLSADHPDLVEFESILFHLEHLPVYTSTDPALVNERRREKEVALGRFGALLERSAAIREHVAKAVAAVNGRPGVPASFDLLHRLLEAQAYRLASWRTAMHEINYRRFFDVNELAGIRQEEPGVFEASHVLLARLVEQGIVTGIRLDHVDGLFEPGAYLRQLSGRLGHPGATWLLVEKILGEGEQLNTDWPVHGTTGYEFLNQVTRLFVDPAGLGSLQRFYERFTGRDLPFPEVVYRSKRTIIATSMAAELNVLAAALNRISESDRRYRDFTLDSLQEALEEVVACFPVYRTYVRPDGWSPADEAIVDGVIATALGRNPALEPTIFAFIRSMLLPRLTDAGDPAEMERRVRFAMKFQQYTAPVQAKGVEDTAFYRTAPLAALNEVGGDPALPDDPVAAFHSASGSRSCHAPFAMVSTATHDTKWGEDARARIAVLSEVPRRWQGMVNRWNRLTRKIRPPLPGTVAPDPTDEYRFYQALVAVWPPDGATRTPFGMVQRLQEYMRKAMREAKVHTSWINPASGYEQAVEQFVQATLEGAEAATFLRSLGPFARRVAWFGMLNSVSQVLLKVTAPGVPDIYQGTETWDLSLVDPDNRRPVNFAGRRAALSALDATLDAPGPGRADRLLAEWPSGAIKLHVLAAALRFRRRWRDIFLEGDYRPIRAEGPAAGHVLAFLRRHGERSVLVVVPRLAVSLSGWDRAERALGETWSGTELLVPEEGAGRTWRCMLAGGTVAGGTRVPLGPVLGRIPWALLASGPGTLESSAGEVS